MLRAATLKLLENQQHDFEQFLRNEPTDKLWNMNGLTVHGFRRIARDAGFEADQLMCVGHLWSRQTFEPRREIHWQALYAASALAARLPGIREIVGSRVCAVLRRA